MKKQILFLYLMNIFLSSLPYYFISILLLRQVGFSYTIIGVLSVVTQIFGSVFDIPLSVFSKKIGYRKILLFSQFLLLLGLGCLLPATIPSAFASAVFFGLSESLSSGVLASYHFEMFEEQKDYEFFLKRSNTLTYLFIALITIISPYLLAKNYRLPLWLSIGFVVISLTCLLQLPEIVASEEGKKQKLALKEEARHVPWQLLLLGVVFTTLIMTCNSYASVYLKEAGIPLEKLGWVLFLFNLAMAIGSHIDIRFEITLLMPLISLALALSHPPYFALGLFLLMRLFNANYNNHFYAKFNQAIRNHRAVSWSIYNFSLSLSFIVADALSGFIADHYGLAEVYFVFGAFALVALLLYIFSRKRGQFSSPPYINKRARPL